MINPNATKVQAFPCAINQGIIDGNGKWINLPTCIYVDDALMLATSIEQMKMVLATMIEAIFTVMGKPNYSVWQCPLAMVKWNELVIVPRQIGLGLIIDTNRLTVAIPLKYLKEVRDLFDSSIQGIRSAKTHRKIGTSCRRGQLGFPSTLPLILFHHIRPSREQKVINEIITRIPGYRSFDTNRSLFYFLQGPCAAYFIRHEMCGKVNTSFLLSIQYQQNYACRNKILCDNLKPESDIEWETPIAHLIP